ncbi:hypothetical protein A3B45_01690 [Candidatus Daviesbacteria bacterium RIFCSPLOWO2_01_FULL_39_12]|uniref:Sulfatase N-terminal domain-containing protein n=1 Tax=Candidatus Daviesbacteria bacterium RIFCSPLOWO2_01_FULL_39_12 TaxID=1797785 RepID=A0A1F5KSI3_9BACT|nr:MAG: hypothetical protein A3B45_01690 [Candidatus Daviesbacteria bacterium RIFCSPLOWO2_01_FULL_39_12]
MRKKVFKIALLTFALLLVLTFLLTFPASPFLKIANPLSKIDICRDCNVIFITMTNLRYDHMSFNGYSRPTTPNLDKLAKESLVFDNAFSHASWTLPEAISIYTSLYPYQHGVMNRYDGSTLSKDTPTLIEVLKKAGYTTAAFTGGFDYNTDFGLTNRFDTYRECTKGQAASYPRQAGPRAGGPSLYGELTCTIPQAIDYLDAQRNSKFFLHVQGFDTHCPFSQNGGKIFDPDYQGEIDFSDCLWTFDRTQPQIKDGKTYYPVYFSKTGTDKQILLAEEDIKHLITIYDEAIVSADEAIGKLLDKVKSLGVWDKTIIVFTSEHGDMFGKQGRFMRGGPLRGTFYDDVLHIPLFIKIPNLESKKIDGLVQQIDLTPTLLNFLGLPEQFHMEGQSLVPLIYQNKQVNDYVFAGAQFSPADINPYFNKQTRVETIRSKSWKLIQEYIAGEKDKDEPQQELFDIQNDPEESTNLAGSRIDMLDNLASKLEEWSKKIRGK